MPRGRKEIRCTNVSCVSKGEQQTVNTALLNCPECKAPLERKRAPKAKA